MMRKIYLFISLLVIVSATNQLTFANELSGKKVFGPSGQTITFNPITNQNYGAADFAPGATASSNLTVTYTSSNSAVATIVSGKIHVVGVGTSVITASQSGDGVNFTSATDVSQTLTVNPVITFAALGTKQYTTTNLSPGAITNYSGTAITYTSSNPAVATIISGQIHFVGLGTTTITAIQPGTGTSAVPYTPFTVSNVLTVSAGAAPVITFTSAATRALQTQEVDPAATSTFSNTMFPIVYTSSDPTIISIGADNRMNLLKVGGPVTITATQPGNGLFADAAPKTVSFSVTVPTITFTLASPKQITNVDLDPAATSTLQSTPIVYTSDNTAVATIVNNKIHYVGTGSVNITASQSAGANSPTPVKLPLTVTAATITFTATLSRAFTTTDTDPGATSTITNVPITYTSSNPAVVSIILNKLHFVSSSPTPVQITASQPGLPSVVQNLTVTPGAITLAATASKQLTNIDFDPAATSTVAVANYPIVYSSSNPAVATIVQNKVHYIGTGLTTITASQGGVVTPDVAQQLTVTAGSITFAALGTKAFSTADLTLAATSTNTTAPITYSSSNAAVAIIVNNAIHYVGLGTSTITASQGGIVPDVPNTLTVSAPTLTMAALGTKNFSAAATDIDPAAVTTLNSVPIVYTSSDAEVATIINNRIHIVGPGTTLITASQAGSGTSAYVAPADVSQVLTVSNLPLITFAALGTKPFSSTDLAPGATSTLTSGSAPVTYTSSDPTVATIVNNAIHYVGTGTTIITASQPSVTGSVIPANVLQLLNVTPATITLPVQAIKAVGNADFSAAATSTLSTTTFPITYTTSDATVATVVGANIHIVGPGTCIITASQNSSANYAPLPATQTLVVVPALITFPLLGNKPFNSTDLAPGATSTAATPAITYTSSNPAVATIVNNAIHYVGVGTTNITATQGGVVTADVTQVLNVVPATITFAALGVKPFNLTDLTPGATSPITTPAITYTSSDPTVATIVANAIHYVGLGTTIITASQGGVVTADVSQPLTVVAPAITFAALGSKAFSSTDLASPGATSTLAVTTVPIVYTSDNPAVATIVNGGIHYVGIGQAVITASQPADPNGAYPAPVSVNSLLTVTPPAITFATTAFLPFSTTDATPTATSTTASPAIAYTSSNPAVVTIVNGKYHFVGLGTTTITASQTDPVNPNALSLTQLLTVYPGTEVLTFSAFPTTVKYGTADFAPTATTTGDPIIFTSSDPTVATIAPGNKVHLTGLGTATITATLNPTSGNYVGSSVLTQKLNVVIGTQTITDIRIPTLLIGQPDYVVSSVASSGLPLTLQVSDSTIASINGLNIKPLKSGSAIVSIIQPGNALFLPDTIREVVYVQHAPGSDVAVSKVLSPNGDGVNDFLYIDGVEIYGGNHMTIINRNGVKVYETDNYNNQGTVFTGKSNTGNGYLPTGTYYYRFDYPAGSGKKYTSGYFVLKY